MFITYSLMITAVLLVVLCSAATANAATVPATVWEQKFSTGTADASASIHAAWQTSDGGYILAGSDNDPGIGLRACLIKTDAGGVKEWERFYGEDTQTGASYSVFQTSDGGFIFTADHGGAGTGWLVKTKDDGTQQWELLAPTITGNDNATLFYMARQTSDGGYIVTGYNSYLLWLLKVDDKGKVTWQRAWGAGDGEGDKGYSVWQTSDGGYIVGGQKWSQDIHAMVLYKTDADGKLQWKKNYEADNIEDGGYQVQQTRDGGYVTIGNSVSAPFVVKTDAQGNKQWIYTTDSLGGTPNSIQQTWDGGYIFGGNFINHDKNDQLDVMLIKLDGSGKLMWQKQVEKCYDTEHSEVMGSVQQIGIGNFLVGWSANPDPQGNNQYGIFVNLSSDMNCVPNAKLVSDTIPTTWDAGKAYEVSVTYENDGTKPWTVQDNTTFSPVPNTDAVTNFSVTTNVSPQVATIVRPGQQYTFSFPMTAPAMNGTYHPGFRMVWEGHYMFGAYDNKTIRVVNGTPNPNEVAGKTATAVPTAKTTGGATKAPTQTVTEAPVITEAPATTETATEAPAATAKKTGGLPCGAALLPLLIIGIATTGLYVRRKGGNR